MLLQVFLVIGILLAAGNAYFNHDGRLLFGFGLVLAAFAAIDYTKRRRTFTNATSYLRSRLTSLVLTIALLSMGAFVMLSTRQV